MQCLGWFVVFLLVLISAQILVLCEFLGRIDENNRSGGGTNTNLLDTSPSPPPASPNQDKSSTNDPELIGVLILLGAILFNVLFFWHSLRKASNHETGSDELVVIYTK